MDSTCGFSDLNAWDLWLKPFWHFLGIILEGSRIGPTQPCIMAADEKDSVERAELNVTDQTSAEFLLSHGFIDRFASDPIATNLGGRCSAAEIDPIPNLRGCSSTAFSFEPQVLFGPQVPFWTSST